MHVYARIWMYMKVWWYKIPKMPIFSISASRLYAWRLIMMECHCSVVRWSKSRSKSCTILTICSGWNQAQADVLSFPQPHTSWGSCPLFQLVILAPFPVYDVACQLPVSWPLKLNNKEVLFVSTYTIRTIYYTYNSHMYTYSIRAIYMHIFIYTCIYVHILCDLKK